MWMDVVMSICPGSAISVPGVNKHTSTPELAPCMSPPNTCTTDEPQEGVYLILCSAIMWIQPELEITQGLLSVL